jgi:hypothetical protein
MNRRRVTVTVLEPRRTASVKFAPSGAPAQSSYPAGQYEFRAAVQAFRTQPLVSAPLLAPQFPLALAAVMGAEFRGTLRLSGVSPGPSFNPSLGLAEEIRAYAWAGPTWWVTVEGTITADAGWTPDRLNSAIARAIARSTSLGPTTVASAAPNVMPGSPIYRSFLSDNPDYRPDAAGAESQIRDALYGACGNGNTCARSMWIRGDLTVFPITTISAPPSPPQPRPVPVANIPDVPTSPVSPAAPVGSAAPDLPPPADRGCWSIITSPAWLRPTPTFDHVGPLLARGSTLRLLHRTNLTQSGLTLWHVEVLEGSSPASAIGQTGYAALGTADTTGGATVPGGCATGVGVQTVDMTGLVTVRSIRSSLTDAQFDAARAYNDRVKATQTAAWNRSLTLWSAAFPGTPAPGHSLSPDDIAQFQANWNRSAQTDSSMSPRSLTVDGQMGPNTRAALEAWSGRAPAQPGAPAPVTSRPPPTVATPVMSTTPPSPAVVREQATTTTSAPGVPVSTNAIRGSVTPTAAVIGGGLVLGVAAVIGWVAIKGSESRSSRYGRRG